MSTRRYTYAFGDEFRLVRIRRGNAQTDELELWRGDQRVTPREALGTAEFDADWGRDDLDVIRSARLRELLEAHTGCPCVRVSREETP